MLEDKVLVSGQLTPVASVIPEQMCPYVIEDSSVKLASASDGLNTQASLAAL